ncbi:MAG: autotransporter-associated beta strand repeat-containing protein, partial [Deltaproteobacteria bacterium]|nr:autotransporter-associated beta strand repeat-containing protein [Candidatus Anaeroferrophillacea bacterium]
KNGTGTLTLDSCQNNFNGNVVINGGLLTTKGTALALGDTTGATTINGGTDASPGGTLNINSQQLVNEPIYVQGVGIDRDSDGKGDGAIINLASDETNALRNVTLIGDTTVGGTNRMDMVASAPGADTFTCNGHDLTVKMTAAISSVSSYFSINDMNVVDLADVIIESGTLNVVRSPLGDPTKTVTITALGQLRIHQIGPDYTGPSSITKPIVSNGGNITVSDAGGKNFWGGAVTLNADTTVNIDSGESLTLFDSVVGTGGIVKNGAGNLLFTGNCTYTGTTVINSGILAFGHSSYQTGTPGSGDFVLEARMNFNTNEVCSLPGDISGVSTGTGIEYGSGEDVPDFVITVSGNNTYNRNTAINHGKVIAGSDTALGSTTGGTSIGGGSNATDNGQLVLPGGRSIAEPLNLGARGDDAADNPHIVNQSGNNQLTGTISVQSGGNFATVESKGTEGGDFLTISGDVSDANSSYNRYFALTGAGNGLLSGNLLNPDTGSTFHLIKKGAGTWTFSGSANTFNGNVIANDGTLILAAGADLSTSSGLSPRDTGIIDITALSPYTLLGTQTLSGSGTLVGDVVAAAGSSIEPGQSPGTLTVDGDLDLSAGADMTWELAALTDDATPGTPGTDYDLAVVTGNVTLGGSSGLTLNFELLAEELRPDYVTPDAFWLTPHSWKVVDAGTNAGDTDFAALSYGVVPEGWSFTTSVGAGGDAGDIYLNYVPEPSTAILLLLAAAGGLIYMKRLR